MENINAPLGGGELSIPMRVMDRCGGLINWNAAMITSNEIFDRLVQVASEPKDHRRMQKLVDLENEIDEMVKLRGRHASVSAALVSGPSARGRWVGTYSFKHTYVSTLAAAEVNSAMQRDLTKSD